MLSTFATSEPTETMTTVPAHGTTRALYITPFISTFNDREPSASQRPTAPVSPSKSIASPEPSISNKTLDFPCDVAGTTSSMDVDDPSIGAFGATTAPALVGLRKGDDVGFVSLIPLVPASPIDARTRRSLFSFPSSMVGAVSSSSFSSSASLDDDDDASAALIPASGDLNFAIHAGSGASSPALHGSVTTFTCLGLSSCCFDGDLTRLNNAGSLCSSSSELSSWMTIMAA
mmetsp:Transcript_8092/g.26758  ORF Transcript_8092/g.26758 Transcript_8092/m.26758 type:complete len:231 (-) Transcript_8092:21-713(-)